MKRLIALPTMIITNSIKAFLLILAVSSATYADTNSVDESSDISTQYIAGDIVSTEGEIQIEVLENSEDRIEIGLFNQEDQITAMLIWDVKTESANVILNFDTENEQTLPIQISEHINPENRMEILADGLLLMEAHTSESILPEETESEPELDTKTNIGVIAKNAISNVTTSGRMAPTDSRPNPSHPFYQGSGRDNVTRQLNGRARLDLADDDPYQRHIWVRLLTRNSDGKWKIMGWAHANKANNGFNFTIPELYDVDRTSNDLNITNLERVRAIAGNKIAYTYTRPYMADAWSGDGMRTNFAWVELKVVWVRPGPIVNPPVPIR
ncbi:MAG: hypothetical protein V3V18_11830 [Methylococcales bacterium]